MVALTTPPVRGPRREAGWNRAGCEPLVLLGPMFGQFGSSGLPDPGLCGAGDCDGAGGVADGAEGDSDGAGVWAHAVETP